MQGKKLLPGQQNVARSRLRTDAPDRRRGDGALDPVQRVGKTGAAQLGLEFLALSLGLAAGFALMTEPVGEDVDQCRLELAGIGVAEFGLGQFLHAVVQQPWMIERCQQDQSLAPRYGGAVTAMQRARGQLRTCGDIAFVAAKAGARRNVAD